MSNLMVNPMIEEKAGKKTKKKRTVLGWIWRSLLGIVLLAILVVLGLYYTGYFHRMLRDVIIDELSKLTKSEVRIGELGGDLITYIEINDFVMGNQCPIDEGVSISLKHAYVYWSPLALLSGRVKIDRVEARGAYCYVAQNPGHKDLNMGEMFGTPYGPPAMTDIEAIFLYGGVVDLNIPGVPFRRMIAVHAEAEVHSSGRVTRVAVNSLNGVFPHLNLPILSFSGAVEYHEKAKPAPDYTPYQGWVLFEKFDMKTPKSHLVMNGRVDNIPTLFGEFNGDGSEINIAEFIKVYPDMPPTEAMVKLNKGAVAIEGDTFSISGDAAITSLESMGLIAPDLNVDVFYSNDELKLNALTGHFSGGTIVNAQGNIKFAEQPIYDLMAAFENVHLSQVISILPETVITGVASFKGTGISDTSRSMELKVSLLPSVIVGVNLDSLTADMALENDNLSVRELNAYRGEGYVLAKGTISPDNAQLRLDVQKIQLSDVAAFVGHENAQGVFSLQGDLSGTLQNLNLNGTFIGNDLVYQGYAAQNVIARINLFVNPELRGRGNLEIENARFAGYPISSLYADMEIMHDSIEIQGLKAEGKESELYANLQIDFQKNLKATVHDMACQYRAIRVLCPDGFSVTDAGGGWQLSPASFDLLNLETAQRTTSPIPGLDEESNSSISQSMGTMTVEGSISKEGDIQASIAVANLPLQSLNTLFITPMGVVGKLDSLLINLSGSIKNPNVICDMTVSDGPIAELPGNGHVRFSIYEGIFTLEDLKYAAGGGLLEGSGSLALDSAFINPFTPSPLTFTLDDLDLRVLRSLTDAIMVQSGSLSGNVTVKGDLLHPNLDGQIHVSDVRFLFGELFSYVSQLSGDIRFKDNYLILGRSSAEKASSENEYMPIKGLLDGRPMEVEGEISMDNLSPKQFHIRLYAGGMTFRGLPGSQFQAQTDLLLTGDIGSRLLLSGKVNIVEGLMNIPFGSNSTEQEAQLLTGVELPFDLDLAVGAEKNIWLRNNDADLELAARVRVEYNRGMLNLSGGLNTIRGVYHFVGRDFQIESGQLEFLGTPTFNPELDVTGMTQIRESVNGNNYIPIYIDLTGTLSHPEVNLRMPAHSEMTLNKLILLLAMNVSYEEFNSMDVGAGTATSDTTSKDSNLTTIISAQSSQYLTAYLSGQIGGVVRRWTSLDTVSVQSQTYYNSNSATVEPQQMFLVTLGKYITRDLYLSYTQQTPNYQNYQMMDLEYTLGGGFSVLGTIGERAREKNLSLSLKYIYRY